jgi:hypothetical protein
MFINLSTRFLFQNCDIKTLMIFSRNAVKLVEFTLEVFSKNICKEKKTKVVLSLLNSAFTFGVIYIWCHGL